MIPRRVLALLTAAIVLAGAGVAAAVTRDDEDDVEQAAATTTTTVFLFDTTTTEAPTTTVAPAATTTTAGGRPGTTSTTRRPTATTRAPAVTTTTARPATPTSTPAMPACTPDHLVAAIAVDRPSYTPGQVVEVTSTLRNRSSTTCFYNGYRFGISFKNDAGTTYGGVNVVADSFADVPLRPGETLTNNGSWDHRACPEPGCAPLPAGPYYATASWSIAGHTYSVLTSLILS